MNYSCGVDWVDKTETSISKGGDDRAIWLDKNRHIARDEKIDAKEALSLAANSDIIIAAMGRILYCVEKIETAEVYGYQENKRNLSDN